MGDTRYLPCPTNLLRGADPVKLVYAHLADYAGVDAGGKLTMVGLFDTIWDRMKVRPIPFPQFHIASVFEAKVTEGTDHRVQVQLIDQRKRTVLQRFDGQIRFAPSGPGGPLRANLLLGFGPGAITVPELANYEFRFLIDGKDVGGVAVTVLEAPPPAE
jgi:uncharacterized protein DUF6941